MTAAPRTRWLGLASLALGLAMIIVDATIVNVAIPSIIEDLGLQLTDAEWVNTVYSLVFAALLVTVGRLGDLYGRKRIYLGGLALFVGASLLCASAPSGTLLIAARALQGIGAACILPSTLSSVNAMFRGRERALAFGIWGSVIGGMAALGPLVGGWLTTDFSWRWAFYINLPIGLVAGTIALLTVPETRDPSAAPGIDLIGIVTSAIGFAALVFRLDRGRALWLVATDGHVPHRFVGMAIRHAVTCAGGPGPRCAVPSNVRPLRTPACPSQPSCPAGSPPLSLPHVSMGQPRGPDRESRRVRHRLRSPALSPGGSGLYGLSNRPGPAGYRHRRFPRGTSGG
jgi:MFS family permease